MSHKYKTNFNRLWLPMTYIVMYDLTIAFIIIHASFNTSSHQSLGWKYQLTAYKSHVIYAHGRCGRWLILCFVSFFFVGRTNESKVFFSRIGSVWSGIVYLIGMILSGIEHLDLVLFLSLRYSHQRISGACWGPALLGAVTKRRCIGHLFETPCCTLYHQHTPASLMNLSPLV